MISMQLKFRYTVQPKQCLFCSLPKLMHRFFLLQKLINSVNNGFNE